MAIDYTRKRPATPPPAPEPAAPAAGGLPSWYTPPDEAEAAAPPAVSPPPSPPPAAGPPAAPAPSASPSPAGPGGYPPPAQHYPGQTGPPGGPGYPPPVQHQPAQYPPPGGGNYPPPGAPGYPPPAQYPPPSGAGYPPPGAQNWAPPPGPAGYPPPGAPNWAPPGPPAAGYQQPPAPQQPPIPQSGPPGYQKTASMAAPGRSPGISLQKVTLTEAAPQVSLTKSGGSSGTIRVNLNWSSGAPAAPSGGGFFKRLAAATSRGVDLDLGCLYELSDGSKGVVQALGNSFGSLDRPPWIKLDGDDRTGSVSGGENMSINLEQPGRFRRVLIFAMIYEGAPNWAAVDGVVTLSPINGPQIEVRLDATSKTSRICAVAQLINSGNDLTVQREIRYIDGGQSVLDKAYGWGMNWSPGRK